MARFKLTIEYEGSRYSGWQLQKGTRSVQGSFFDACKSVFDSQPFEFYGAGRTDGGVHALGQVAHLEVKTNLSLQQIRFKLNDALPYDINILSVEQAAPKFHARYDATARSYLYLISTRRSAFGKNYSWWIKDKLNVTLMQQAAEKLSGFKDYQSFTDKDAETDSTKVEVNWIDVHKTDDLIVLHFVASHFLWKMVRRITGVLVEAGREKLPLNEIQGMLKSYSPVPAKLTAPGSGLYLHKVYYDNQVPERGRELIPQILSLK
ncbi:MAG: tRNA pseudouridine(38-40) synthase TruA [Bacteroidota bacterium]